MREILRLEYTPVSEALSPTGVMSRIMLLGLLAWQPMHGYELRQVIERRRMERWSDVRYGSIYAGLRRLVAEGLVEEAGVTRQGGRPPRTVYRITQAGRRELDGLLRRAFSALFKPSRPVDAALGFAWLLPADELAALLAKRIEALDALVAELAADEARIVAAVGELPATVVDLFEHSRRLAAAERD